MEYYGSYLAGMDVKPETGIDKLVASICKAKAAGTFQPYIDFIQFAKYRGFEAGTRISFEFPLTVLVGQNGSGKSSVLHALSGAPEKSSVGNYWFGTDLDPIDTDEPDTRRRTALAPSAKSAFWYGYTKNGVKHEVLKMRIRRPGDPDYWEPSRPVKQHGMQLLPGKKRSPAIAMDVTYLNFKTQLNAFDRCFYFYPESILKQTAKTKNWIKYIARGKPRAPRIQDYLRSRSKQLRRILVDQQTVSFGRHVMHEPVVELTSDELAEISQIIGRTYSAGRLVKHRLYETWGTSVLFTTEQRSYSEAFAGSGEASVVRLVHDLTRCAPGQLVLLDEPETSLHPGAQEKLLAFLLRKVLAKKLQCVLSTHSPALVRHLPAAAIKVLSLDPDGSFRCVDNVSAHEAFYFIGHPVEDKINIVVEDVLAKLLLEAVLANQSAAFAARFEIAFRPGGDTGIKQDISTFMLQSEPQPFVIFDGDVRPSASLFSDSISREATVAQLDSMILDEMGMAIRFLEDSNMPEADRANLRVQFVTYFRNKVRYLPCASPEEAIWNDDTALELCKAFLPSSEVVKVQARLEQESTPKQKFRQLTISLDPKRVEVTSDDIIHFQKMFVTKFCATREMVYQQIETLLRDISEHA